MNYWLMKSEPDVFGIDDLKARGPKGAHWDGVRNYQARNFMRAMARGDLALFYHSNCEFPGITGVMQVIREAYPDHTAFDPEDPHFDPKSDPENPRWYMVDIAFVERFPRAVGLVEMRENAKLAEMLILRRGNRLSITPVTKKEWDVILRMGRTRGKLS
ncbi:MAG TPA: EVE domain-containing protein [Gammaproteobacteria bacterium]